MIIIVMMTACSIEINNVLSFMIYGCLQPPNNFVFSKGMENTEGQLLYFC